MNTEEMITEATTMEELEPAIEASFKKANGTDPETWDKLASMKEEKTPLDVTIEAAVKAGVVTHVEGIRAFIPASKLSFSYVENLEEFVNKEVKVLVIEADMESKKLVLSVKDYLRIEKALERQKKIDSVEVGAVMDGTVETIKDYGAFINLGEGISGLVHVSQISAKRIKTPADVLKEGDEVKVKVTAIKDGKISLSMKALLEKEPKEEAAPVEEKIDFKLPKAEKLTTNLGDLLKGLNL